MTNAEQVQEIEAGRELDILIAERVFGMNRLLARVDPCNRNGEPQFHWGYPLGHDFAPNYSTDIAAAWLVLKAMRGWPFSARLTFGNELSRLVCERKEHKGIVIHLTDLMIYMEPIDICRAALKAFEETQDSRA